MCMAVYWPQSPYTGHVHGGLLTAAPLHWLCAWWSTEHSPLTLAVWMVVYWPQPPYIGGVHGGLLTTVHLHWQCAWWSTDHGPLTLAVCMAIYWPVASPYTDCVYGCHLILAVYMVCWPVVTLHWLWAWRSADWWPPYTSCVHGLLTSSLLTLAVSMEVYWVVAPLHWLCKWRSAETNVSICWSHLRQSVM